MSRKKWIAPAQTSRRAGGSSTSSTGRWIEDSAPKAYEGPVAADYPDCLAILEEKVKPERMKNNRKVYRDRWWHYAEKRPELYRTIAGMQQVLLKALTSKHHGFSAR